jgi:hypothetical protein
MTIRLAAVLLVLSAPGAAGAAEDDPEGGAGADGAYGRLAGDVAFGGEAGASLEAGDVEPSGSLALRLGTFYLSTVGLTVQYNDRLGLDDDAEDEGWARSLAPGLELRPLFLGRFARDLERGPPHADLILDSIGIGLGAYVAWPAQSCDARAGTCVDHGMELSLGAEIPFLAQAATPFLALRAAMRWSLVDRSAALPAPSPVALLTVTIGYRHLFTAHLVDAGDVLE